MPSSEMLSNLLVAAFSALIMWALWRVAQPPRVFVVHITSGEPRAVAGSVTGAFLQRLREVAAEHGVARAWVWGVARRGRISLGFSGHMPPAGRQQLRNWWAVSGWTVKHRSTRRRGFVP
jgi:hypothetical protein